jgi:thiamine biosynthesis lipoprotein
MACQFELMLNAGQYANGTEAALEALDVVGALENQMSYFQPTSQISRLNALAADTPIEVEPRLFELLKLAIELHGQTEGAFDIAAGAVWEVWGFSRRAGKIPSDAELAGALASVGSHLVQLDPERRTVRLAKPGVRLNLGSLGKGYALDRAGELLAGAGIADYLFHGGQSSILARGSRLGLSSGQTGLPQSGWTVGIRHPLAPKRRLAELRLRDRALGTSGSTQQFFRHRGRRYAHILDPRTGQPAQAVLSATVVAPPATLADALSTALFVMGPERGLQFLHSRPEVAAVLVCPAVGRGGFEVITAGFSREQLTLL